MPFFNFEKLCISSQAVPAHLLHGDALGMCAQSTTRSRAEVINPNDTPGHTTLKLAGYPNPFTNNTTITYYFPSDGNVIIRLYDVTGKEVTTLVNGNRIAGLHRFNFAKGNLPTGIYYANIVVAASGHQFSYTERLAILPQ